MMTDAEAAEHQIDPAALAMVHAADLMRDVRAMVRAEYATPAAARRALPVLALAWRALAPALAELTTVVGPLLGEAVARDLDRRGAALGGALRAGRAASRRADGGAELVWDLAAAAAGDEVALRGVDLAEALAGAHAQLRDLAIARAVAA